VNDRFAVAHDDMLGEVRSAISGATQWDTGQINDTGFILGWLKNNSSDFFQAKIQICHRRYLGQNLDSIHVHYLLESASTLNETILFTGAYVWIKPGSIIPANSGWTALSGAGLTLTLTTQSAYYYGIHLLQTNIAPPVNEGYGGILLIKVTRGNGTHTGRFGILDCDVHTPINRLGSYNEASD
jgi:hypothetical protein